MLASRQAALATPAPQQRRLSAIPETTVETAQEWHLPVEAELASKRGYRLLDVYSDEQGWLRMTSYIAVLSCLLLIGVYFFVYELLLFNATAYDTLDMIKNYQQTSRVRPESYAALAFRPSASSLLLRPVATATVNGADVPLSAVVDSRGGVGNPLLTDYRSLFLTGEALLRLPNPAVDPQAQTQFVSIFSGMFTTTTQGLIFVGGSAFASVPTFRITRDYDAGTATVERLTLLRVGVLFDPATTSWSFAHTRGSAYGDRWTGRIADMGTAYPNAAYAVRVTIVDASLPAPPEFPAPAFTFRLYFGFFLLGLTFLAFWSLTCLAYQLKRNSKENRGLPPLFFASMTRFRGW
eukprot:tig00000615_g2576.t1